MADNAQSMADTLKERLQNVAHFIYLTKDGDAREAFGTVKPELIPRFKPEQVLSLIEASSNVGNNMEQAIRSPKSLEQDPDGFSVGLKILSEALAPFQPKEGTSKSKAPVEGLLTYFDIEKQGWRSFYVDKLVSVFG